MKERREILKLEMTLFLFLVNKIIQDLDLVLKMIQILKLEMSFFLKMLQLQNCRR